MNIPTFVGGLPYLIMILVVLDVILTYYQFFLDKKKGTHTLYHEENWLPRTLMKKIGLKPISLVMHSFFQIIFFGSLIILSAIFFQKEHMGILGIFFGMTVMVNYYHYFNIKFFKDHWNDEMYWEKRRIEARMKENFNKEMKK